MAQLVDARHVLGVPKPTTDFIGTTRELYGWQPAAHHRIWAQALTKLAAREIPSNRLLIIAPPGHAKTNWAGIAFPSWYIAQHQYEHVLSFSATSSLSRKSGTTIRDTVANSQSWRSMYPQIKPDMDKGWAQTAWFVHRPLAPGDKDPTMFSTSVGSQNVLGSRGDLLLFDDISTQENTRTQGRRDLVREWVSTTAFSRATPEAIMVAIMTRWHTDDMAAYFEREGFHTIVMPANGYWENPDDYRHARIEGEPLWPQHVSAEMLLKQRHSMGDFKYTAMFQGNPVAVEGAVFREKFFGPWFVHHDAPEAQVVLKRHNRAVEFPLNAIVVPDETADTLIPMPLTYKAVFVDTALKAGEDNDYTEFALWGVGIDRQAYLLDEFHMQVDAVDLFEQFIIFWRKHQPDIAVIEDKGSGIQLIQDIQRKTRIPIATTMPTRSKEERARGQAHVINGAFHIPDPNSATTPEWVAEFLSEHLDFPRGTHDDRVDTTSMAAEHLKHMLDFFERDSDDVFNVLPDQVTHGARERGDGFGGGLDVVDGESMFGSAPDGFGVGY